MQAIPRPQPLIDYPLPPLVTQCFLRWAQLTPHAPAVRETGRIWSYDQLARMAVDIAGKIHAVGCEPQQIVAISGPRGGSFIASLLGVLLARCVVLPLDPGQPPGWQQRVLDEADAGLLLTCGDSPLPLSPLRRLSIEPPSFSKIPGESEQDLDELCNLPGLNDPAYLFFTSGTTGRPKGVLGTHGGLGHFLAWQRETFEVIPGDRIAHVTGLSFDVVLREIFVALTSGATLSIPARETLEDPRQLTLWLAREGVTLLHAVPTVAAAWLREAEETLHFPALRATFFAGEPLPRQLVLRWRERLKATAEIINLYGPTETTLAKCWYRVPQLLPCEQLPVGNPLPEADIYIFDEDRKPVVNGEAGEVIIRTPWRSLGYINSDSPFRPNPFGNDPEDLIYPTGDRGRWLDDGTLELLGRIDDQVKIRGVRIEPAGVAAVLLGHPDVSACAVLALREPSPPRLAAFVVGTANRFELRRFLAGKLADAMIPTEFFFLKDLPHNANGKLDRPALLAVATKALPEPARVSISANLPQTTSEQLVAEIYREILDLPEGLCLTVADDFFDLGGDSLRALAVISRANQKLGMRLDVSDLFESPDIEGLGRRLDALQGLPATAAAVPLLAVPRNQKLPLSPAQERIWFQCQLEGQGSTAYNVPVAIEMNGPLDVPALERALSELCRRHEVLRTTFPVDDGTAWQRINPLSPIRLPMVDLGVLCRDVQSAEVQRYARQQAKQTFQLDQDPMLRALLLRQGDRHHLLLLTLHHLVFDGWSRWLLIRELGVHYSAARRGERETLPAPVMQYADYAVWRRQQSPRAESLSYWRQRLADAPRADLPGDYIRPARHAYQGALVRRSLPPELVDSLEELAGRERATLYMLLLTGFNIVLAGWSGSLDLTIGSPVANRPHPDLEQLLGCFIETLPIRTDLTGNPSCLELLRRIRAGVIDAFTHADVSFETIVAQLGPPRFPGRHPLFDVMFNLVSVPQRTAEMEGLTLGFPEETDPESRFDFSLYARKNDSSVELRLVYQKALFKPERMERLLDAFVAVLHQLVDNPDASIATLKIDLERPAAEFLPSASKAEVPADSLPFEAPRNADEEQVAKVYGELLGCGSLSIHDNFFALGGHSLLATQALSRLQRHFANALPLSLMFAHQTVAELASAIRAEVADTVKDVRIGEPVTPAQQRLLNYMADNPCSTHFNVSRRVLLRGPVDAERLEQAIRQVVSRHTVFFTGYRMVAGAGSPISLADETVRLQQVDLRTSADPVAAAGRLISEETARPFDLDSGPLFRATLIRTADAEHTLLIAVHHVTADCWSMGMPFGSLDTSARAWMAGVFFRQLWSRYHALGSGVESPLPQRTYQFEEVARRQSAWLASREAARQVTYWQELLADRPEALTIPPDFKRPPAWDFLGERLPLCIDPEITSALRALAREHHTTLFVVLQAAFGALLHGLTGKVDLVIGTTASNRSRWDADDLIGFFSNNLLLRTSLAGDPSFHEIIRRSHAAAFAAFSHQELPFERVLEALQVDVPADRHPLFQIRFLLHLPSDKPFVAGDLCMLPVPIGRDVAKYDLTLLLADDGTALEGWLEYAASLYRRSTAERILSQYQSLLAELVACPDLPLSTHWSSLP